MSGRITEKLVADALKQAMRKGSPDDFSMVFHDDQGSRYASRAFQGCPEGHGIAQSVSRPGNPWDNALAESFFKTPKRELANGKSYKTRGEAKQDVFKYIELQQAEDAFDPWAQCAVRFRARCSVKVHKFESRIP